MEGDVFSLSTLLSLVGLSREGVGEIAQKVAKWIKESAEVLSDRFNDIQKKDVSRTLGQRSPLSALRTMVVLWLNALLTQQRLQSQGVIVDGTEIPSLPFNSEVDVQKIIQTWQLILSTNWRSIFEPAIECLRETGNFAPKETKDTLKNLIASIHRIETQHLGLHISVGAELFPLMSDDRKPLAAFYTKPATAELLAHLTITKRGLLGKEEWRDEHLFQKRIICDLACGTGTLLRAGYARVLTLHGHLGGEADKTLHRDAMEGGVRGADVSAIAAHLTTSSMAAMGYGDPYGDPEIGWVETGGTLHHL